MEEGREEALEYERRGMERLAASEKERDGVASITANSLLAYERLAECQFLSFSSLPSGSHHTLFR